MKKSDYWLLREGIARDMHKTFSLLESFIGRHEKRMERLEERVYKIEHEKNRIQKKGAKAIKKRKASPRR